MNKSIEDQWPRCADHQDCPYQYILLSKKSESNRLKCIQCLYSKETLTQKEEIKESFPLPLVLTSPELMVNVLKKEWDGKYIKQLFEICEKDMDQQFNEQITKFDLLVKIFNQMKDQIKQKLQLYKEAQEKLRKQKEQFLEVILSLIKKCQFNLLHKLIFQLKELDKQIKSDQYTSILTKINSTLEEMLKDDCSLLTQNIFEMIQNHKQMKINLNQQNNDQFQQQITQLFTQYTNFIGEINKSMNSNSHSLSFPEFKLLSSDYFKILQLKIEEGSKQIIKSMNLIYLGSRDGLNAKAYWGKIDGKKNLLMVFKQQNNQIFGGYSPCTWQTKSVGYWVGDDIIQTIIRTTSVLLKKKAFKENQNQFLEEQKMYCQEIVKNK